MDFPWIIQPSNAHLYPAIKTTFMVISFFATQHKCLIALNTLSITKTSPCNEHPLTPNFYIVKLGFKGVYNFSYFCSKTSIVGTRKNRLAEAVLTCTHNQCFGAKIRKIFKIVI